MAIEVMLMDNVKKLGKAGEIVKVAPGYARNYLFTKGLAAVATEAAKRRLKKLEAERAARAAEEKKAALEVAKKLEKLDYLNEVCAVQGYNEEGKPDVKVGVIRNKAGKRYNKADYYQRIPKITRKHCNKTDKHERIS